MGYLVGMVCGFKEHACILESFLILLFSMGLIVKYRVILVNTT